MKKNQKFPVKLTLLEMAEARGRKWMKENKMHFPKVPATMKKLMEKIYMFQKPTKIGVEESTWTMAYDQGFEGNPITLIFGPKEYKRVIADVPDPNDHEAAFIVHLIQKTQELGYDQGRGDTELKIKNSLEFLNA